MLKFLENYKKKKTTEAINGIDETIIIRDQESPELSIQKDPEAEKEIFKQSIAEVNEYIATNNGNIDPETIEMITGMPLEKVFENLADQKLELSLNQLQSSITQTIDDMDSKPSVLEFFRKQFKKSATKAAFVTLMLFLKFAPDLQAVEEGNKNKEKFEDEKELVQENKVDDGKTLELTSDDFVEAELSPAEFINKNIENIRDIIGGEKYEEVINNPYLISSLYYSQKFLNNISNEANQKNLATKIIGPIVKDLSPEFKLETINYFKNLSQDLEKEKGIEISELEVIPLKSLDYGHGIGHNDALDLYIQEGSNISAMQDGIVILAETGWSPDNEASTSSYLGGNTVITYNYKTNEFVRYAHLDNVSVKPGDIIKAGDDLGTVGNTGMNAYKPGQGNHLHLEINQVKNDGSSQFVQNKQIQERINNIQTIASR